MSDTGSIYIFIVFDHDDVRRCKDEDGGLKALVSGGVGRNDDQISGRGPSCRGGGSHNKAAV